MIGGLDYRFSERKPKRRVAKVRIKSVALRENYGPEYLATFRENGCDVAARMALTRVDVDFWGGSRTHYERVA